MFLPNEERKQGEPHREQQVKPLKLSEAIRIGHEMIGENHRGFLACGEGCALGAAWVGSGRSEEDYRACGGGCDVIFSHLQVALKVPRHVLDQVNVEHYCGKPRLVIADWLESQGY